MPGIEHVQGFEPRTEQVHKRIQELKARAAEGLDDAMNIVEKNFGRREAREVAMGMEGLGQELAAQEAAIHNLDLSRVADLISDPFEE